MTTLTLEIKATELAQAIEHLAAALQTMGALEKAASSKARKAKTEPAPPAPADEPTAEAAAPVQDEPAPQEEAPAITTYEQLRSYVAPLLADPNTKTGVAKLVKKYCTGKLQDIKTEDYPALIESLKELVK
jgi:hypothetical protein